ncbi:protein CREG1 [Ciona intestinalis]
MRYIVFVLVASSTIVCAYGLLASPYNPPYYWEEAKRARYAIHYNSWGVIGTISTQPKISGFPFTNIISYSDGPDSNSTGTPYFYVMNGDPSVQDLAKNNSMSFSVSEMEPGYCEMNKYDAEDPRCARITIIGHFEKVTSPSENKFAIATLFKKHPEMQTWPAGHDFFTAKIRINFVWILDHFGGSSFIKAADYYAADPSKAAADPTLMVN